MAKKTKTKSRKSSRSKRQPDRTFKVLLASLFLVGFLVASLAVLTFVQRTGRSGGEPDAAVAPGRVTPRWSALSPELRNAVQLEIERSLWRQGVAFAGMRLTGAGDAVHYHLEAPYPGPQWWHDLERQLRRKVPGIVVRFEQVSAPRLSISFADRLLFLLHFQPAVERRQTGRPPARIAIVVDDLGRDLRAARELLDIDLDLTIAVMPEEVHARDTAELAHRAGREVLVHMPMEPQSYPRNDPGPGALLLGQDDKEIRRRVLRMFERVPFASGGNNHMGSRFTRYREGMQSVVKVLHENGWFFVDSRTSAASVGLDVARRAGVPHVGRDVFLDNNRDVDAIAVQLRQTVKLARSRRRAVAICHPYPETIKALRQEAAFLHQQDLEVVPVSRLLRGRAAGTR